MKVEFDLEAASNLIGNVNHYNLLASHFPQLKSGEEGRILREYWNKNIVKRDTNVGMTHTEWQTWKQVNVHIITQSWGNTSGGWETIGGSAFISDFTYIIENPRYNIACIYYGNKLAYVCEMNENYKKYSDNGYRNLPGMGTCSKTLTVIYKK